MEHTTTHDEEVREGMLNLALDAHDRAREVIAPLNALEAESYDLTVDDGTNVFWIESVRKAKTAYWQLMDALNGLI